MLICSPKPGVACEERLGETRCADGAGTGEPGGPAGRCLIFGLALAAAGAWNGISPVKAELGDGTHGSFAAVTLECGRGCSWHGDFETGGAIVARDVTYIGGVNGIYPGSSVPAIYESGVDNA